MDRLIEGRSSTVPGPCSIQDIHPPATTGSPRDQSGFGGFGFQRSGFRTPGNSPERSFGPHDWSGQGRRPHRGAQIVLARDVVAVEDGAGPMPGRNPRRRRRLGRCTRPPRSSRRWWAPGTTSPKAPTTSSSPAEGRRRDDSTTQVHRAAWGRIWVESQVGQGSMFTFTLPVRRGD